MKDDNENIGIMRQDFLEQSAGSCVSIREMLLNYRCQTFLEQL